MDADLRRHDGLGMAGANRTPIEVSAAWYRGVQQRAVFRPLLLLARFLLNAGRDHRAAGSSADDAGAF